MKKIRTLIASAAITASALTGAGLAVTASTAPAGASASALQTVTKTETLLSGRTYHLHQVTRTYYHWVTAKHSYVRYPNGPRVTVTDQTITHK